MKITKILNNNAVIGSDETSRECVVLGKGLGFASRVGDEIKEHKIEKIFSASDPEDLRRKAELLRVIPHDYFIVTQQIVDYAAGVLNKELNRNLTLTLADHIHFTVRNWNIAVKLVNPLLWEIRQFYTVEFLIGRFAVERIAEAFHVSCGDAEAASIAMHVINAELNRESGPREARALSAANLVGDVLERIQDEFRITVTNSPCAFNLVLVQLLKSVVEDQPRPEAAGTEEIRRLLAQLLRESAPDLYMSTDRLCGSLADKYHLPQLRTESGLLAYLILRMQKIEEQTAANEKQTEHPAAKNNA